MKKVKDFKFVLMAFVMMVTSLSFTSCSDDDSGLNPVDPAGAVAGQYEGKLTYYNSQYDAYLKIARESSREVGITLVCNTLEINDHLTGYVEVNLEGTAYELGSDLYYIDGVVKGKTIDLKFGEDKDLRFKGELK